MDITWKRKWIFWLLLAVMLLFLPGKTFAAEKESREAEDSYIYHTAFDAKASLKIRHMKDYGVLDYEETVTVEDSCDYLDGDEIWMKSRRKLQPMMRKFKKCVKECRLFPVRTHEVLTAIRLTLNMKIRKKTDRPLPPDILSDLQDPDRLGTGKDGDFGCEYCEQHTFLLCR